MNRLTAKGEQGAYLLCTGDYEDMVDEAIDRLAYYEDLGEQGRLIVLPCKVGDTVWQVHPSYCGARQVTYHSVSGIVEDLEKGWRIGDTIEEAEAALGGDGDA